MEICYSKSNTIGICKIDEKIFCLLIPEMYYNCFATHTATLFCFSSAHMLETMQTHIPVQMSLNNPFQ